MTSEDKPVTPENKPTKTDAKDERKARASRFFTPGDEIKYDKETKTVTV